MPIASLANLQWNGTASAAMVDFVSTDEDVAAKLNLRANSTTTVIVLDSVKATRLFGQPFSDQVVVTVTIAAPKKTMRVNMVANVAAQPTAFDVAQAIGAMQLAGFTAAGSAGKAWQDAGSAGNPWSADLSSNNTDGTFGAFVQKLLTFAKFLGFK